MGDKYFAAWIGIDYINSNWYLNFFNYFDNEYLKLYQSVLITEDAYCFLLDKMNKLLTILTIKYSKSYVLMSNLYTRVIR